MTTPPPPPAPNGPGYGYPQQPGGGAQPVPGAPGPAGAAGFGPPPGLPTAPGMAPAPGLPAAPGAGAAPRPGRSGNLRRNAVWAFVGAVIVSVGWTAAVMAVPGLVSSESSPRGLRGYHLSDDFCTTGKPTRILQTHSVSDTSAPTHHTDRHPALDSMNCSMSLKRTGGNNDSEYANVYLRADLHKAVNPAPELEANKELYRARGYQVTDIAGLGEEAYFLYKDDGSDKYHSVYAELDIRDGGMTYYINYSASYTEGKGKPPSKEELRSALQSDGQDAVRAMKK
ncbi:hypothetical protein ACIRRH_00490 [Kitasatospora sp. NPDC101235]|uniref:hypothetical protein n=1 Tax=Kitasatospora sp. NPDC101235 TaxID=3364101 RepID=UPI0037F4FD41